jgi:hypothetical protein
MANGDKSNGVVGQIVVTVVVALLVGGTSPWWWHELIVKKNDPTPTPTSTPNTTPTPISSVIPTPISPTPEPQRTGIDVAYTGDNFGCTLPIAINIGDQEFYPKGNLFQAVGIETGQQRYRVSGQIYCPPIGNCQLYGEGSINIIPGNTYYLAWQNVGVGQCAARLQ